MRALQSALDREREFVSDASHEIRSRLAAIVAEISVIEEERDDLPPDVRRPAELLARDIARLRKLVDDLLDLARLDRGLEPLQEEEVDLGALVNEVVAANGWQSEVELLSEPARARTDPRHVARIVTELVGNAVKHAGIDVRVWVHADGGQAVVDVSDAGAGIAEELRPHLFSRFAKKTWARTGKGSGLGLDIAVGTARLLGGTIEVDKSGRLAGCRFTFRLPAAGAAGGRSPR